jgi:hypothetical protein
MSNIAQKFIRKVLHSTLGSTSQQEEWQRAAHAGFCLQAAKRPDRRAFTTKKACSNHFKRL